MKRNLLSITALVLAIVASSFTAKWTSLFYMVFNSGAQNSISNYAAPTTDVQDSVLGSDVLCWIAIESVDSQIDNAEFLAAFSALDEGFTQPNNLNDESEKIKTFSYNGISGLHVFLEKKAID
ncbi:hypothetical protein [Niastella sp. OAS944]|uniref:hypothetical protein n=1 Tax=Niastella sp. OAS944 TaxID=2664089 RepID=UPI00347DEB25|nr:hypothetical protein [Chitinophagaceae bacterium OAS944]